ncbi:MAG: hypothetical protein PHQ66_02895 [Candidatus Nanoarchaeia archaeon]|nr:hypothetical protein [Candidatus Nanoarchaeia archaeon]MDD5357687.1 hypothetical protein [Candidatus Nanoarchaeia archaeon]MDD5588606.1 hypothetical protein [Candidatus Nanoarchaeia archaeon]
MNIMRNNRGWIEIVEAFFAVLLIAAVILILLNKGYFKGSDLSDEIYNVQISILREIQTNDTLRADITAATSGIPGKDLPVEWDNPNFPDSVKKKIIERTPSSLNCVGQICNMTEICTLSEQQEKDIYSESATISSTLKELVFRKLNLFCWMK